MNLTAQRYDWTYSEYARLPDDGSRYEVLDGELLMLFVPESELVHVSDSGMGVILSWTRRG